MVSNLVGRKHLLQQSTSTQQKQKKTCEMMLISVIQLYEHMFPGGGALELSMRIFQSAFGLKMKIICKIKLVKMLTKMSTTADTL